MDSSGSVWVFSHFLDAAMSPGSFCHCSQETLRRSAELSRDLERTCGLVIMNMSVSFFIFFGGGVDLRWEFPHLFPQDLTPD